MKKILLLIPAQLLIILAMGQSSKDHTTAILTGSSGWHAFVDGNYDNSIAFSRKALGLDSTLSWIRFNLALAYLVKKQDSLAEKEYRKGINITKRSGIHRETLDSARADLIKYLQLIPSQSIAYQMMELLNKESEAYAEINSLFLHVPGQLDSVMYKGEHAFIWDRKKVSGVNLICKDTSGQIIWISDPQPAEPDDSLNYFVRVEVPSVIYGKTVAFDVTYQYSTWINRAGGDAIELLYASENQPGKFSNIKLIISTVPQGADVFLVPNRIWRKQFNERDLTKISEQELSRYRVNRSLSDTYANIDETTFMVIVKMGNRIKNQIHYTEAARLAPEQIVKIQF